MLPAAQLPGGGAGGEEGGGAEDQEEVPGQASADCGEVSRGQEHSRDGQGLFTYKKKMQFYIHSSITFCYKIILLCMISIVKMYIPKINHMLSPR